MHNLLPEFEPHFLMVFRLDDQRHALRSAVVEQRALEMLDPFHSPDELAALEKALESR